MLHLQNDIKVAYYLENMLPDDRLLYWRKKYPPPVSINHTASEADSDDEGSYSITEQFSTLEKRHAHSRTISTRKVCWHRNASISMKEYTLSIEVGSPLYIVLCCICICLFSRYFLDGN